MVQKRKAKGASKTVTDETTRRMPPPSEDSEEQVPTEEDANDLGEDSESEDGAEQAKDGQTRIEGGEGRVKLPKNAEGSKEDSKSGNSLLGPYGPYAAGAVGIMFGIAGISAALGAGKEAADAHAKIIDLYDKLNSFNGTVNKINGTVNGIGNTTKSLNDNVTNLTALYGAVAENVTALKTNVTGLQRDLANYNISVVQLERNLAENASKLQNITPGATDLTEINSTLAGLKANYTALNSVYLQLLNNYAALNQTVNTLKAGNITGLEKQVKDLETLRTNITAVENTLKSADSRISTLEGAVSNLTKAEKTELDKTTFAFVYNQLGANASALMEKADFNDLTDGNKSNYELNGSLAAVVTPTDITYKIDAPDGRVIDRKVSITSDLYKSIKQILGVGG